MSLTPSSMPELGFTAPDFTLPDVFSGHDKTLKDIAGPKGVLVMFICMMILRKWLKLTAQPVRRTSFFLMEN